MSAKVVCIHVPFFHLFLTHVNVFNMQGNHGWERAGPWNGKVIWKFAPLGHLLCIRPASLVDSQLKLLPFDRCAAAHVKWVGVKHCRWWAGVHTVPAHSWPALAWVVSGGSLRRAQKSPRRRARSALSLSYSRRRSFCFAVEAHR